MVFHHPLAFGESAAVDCNSLLTFAENTRQAVPSLLGYDAERPREFRTRSSFKTVNGMSLFSASMPNALTHAHVGGCKEHTFGFHLAGECAFDVERHTLRVRPKESAIFLPAGCGWHVRVSNPSTVIVSLNANHLEATARTMLGESFRESLLPRLHNPAELALQFKSLSFDGMFRNLFSQVDIYSDQQSMLDASGIDDVFCRTLVLALAPGAFAKQSDSPMVRVGSRQLRHVAEYVMSHLAHRITLTDLENVGHMSRRTLHNTFIRAYGVSPMEWVREQRLLAARQRLSDARSADSVTGVLYSCGFTSPSLFAAQYARRFGERPSLTLAKRRGQ